MLLPCSISERELWNQIILEIELERSSILDTELERDHLFQTFCAEEENEAQKGKFSPKST